MKFRRQWALSAFFSLARFCFTFFVFVPFVIVSAVSWATTSRACEWGNQFSCFCLIFCVPILAKIDFAYFSETFLSHTHYRTHTLHPYARLHGVWANVCWKQNEYLIAIFLSATKTKKNMHSRSVTLHVRHGRQSIHLPFILLFYLNREY